MDPSHEKYDNTLLSILQNEGKVAPFLDVILGFLYRRTDFFRLMKSDTDRLGFPPGVALKLITNIFKRYEALSKGDSDKREQNKTETTTDKAQPKKEKLSASKDSLPTSSPNSNENDGSCINTEPKVPPKENKSENFNTMERSEQDKHNKKESDSKSNDEEEEEDPEKARERRALQANPLTYNGADRDGYFWSQNIMEVDIRVKVPQHIVKGRQVRVTIRAQHLQVAAQDVGGQLVELVNGDLAWEVKAEDSMWTLCPGEFVHVNLEKRQERWWENVFPDEPKINTRKIDCSRPMEDLDDEAQAKIAEMMYNQRQKQLGLPQSHEMKSQDMLRKAWDAEGSPFKGQPFDPSKFSVDPNGVVNINSSDP